MTLQLTRDSGYGRGFFSPRSVTGFLSDVCSAAADEVGKIYLTADENVSFGITMLNCLAFVSVDGVSYYFLSVHIFTLTCIGYSSMQGTTDGFCIKSALFCIKSACVSCFPLLLLFTCVKTLPDIPAKFGLQSRNESILYHS